MDFSRQVTATSLEQLETKPETSWDTIIRQIYDVTPVKLQLLPMKDIVGSSKTQKVLLLKVLIWLLVTEF